MNQTPFSLHGLTMIVAGAWKVCQVPWSISHMVTLLPAFTPTTQISAAFCSITAVGQILIEPLSATSKQARYIPGSACGPGQEENHTLCKRSTSELNDCRKQEAHSLSLILEWFSSDLHFAVATCPSTAACADRLPPKTAREGKIITFTFPHRMKTCCFSAPTVQAAYVLHIGLL